jgi:two-component system OmpR family sensor kinase
MQSIRGQLATWYALAMGATLGVFAVTVYVVERPWISERIDERLQIEADLISAILSGTRFSIDSTTRVDTTEVPSDVVNPWVAYGLDADVAAVITGISDYVLLLSSDPARVQSFFNERAAAHDVPAQNVFASAARQALADGVNFGVADLGRPVGTVRFFVDPIGTPDVSAVVVGVPNSEVRSHLDRLLSVMMGVATLVVAASTWIAYLLAGRTLKPVDLIVDEVEAISDGRSLHRRLAVPRTMDEASRLASTLNAMISRLESSFFLLRRFTADASHELKTPLTVLRSGIERAITHPDTSDEVLEVLEETLVEVNRMTELVDSLLMLARTDEGRAGVLKESVDLREIMSEVAETASILEEGSAVTVSVMVPDKPRMVMVDRGRIRQLLMNLLTNAIKFNQPGGSVTVETDVEEGTLVINVRDTGVGMSGAELEHLYQRFWRADPARSRTGQRAGTGLGMAISKWIAEAHGGSIEAKSKRGKGTTMTVKLPIEDEV